MKKAFANIKTKLKNDQIRAKDVTASLLNLEIKASHYYVKFLPESDEQEGFLKSDTTMELFDYPLDWEFTDKYLENRPPIEEGKYPTYYTAVPVNKNLPEVPYEIIEDLYIPEEDPRFNEDIRAYSKGTARYKINTKVDMFRHLLKEAYSLTGNEADLLEAKKKDEAEPLWIFGSRWYPSGTIRIWDDNIGTTIRTRRVFDHWEYYPCDDITPLRIPTLPERICRRAVYRTETYEEQGSYVPLVGAKVVMVQWFVVRKGYTNNNGYFWTGRIRGKARYKIKWERYQWSIRSGTLGQAETRGPKVIKRAWNLNIRGGKPEYYGHIHRACYNYYYGNIDGLLRPPTNGVLKTQMKIAAYDKYRREEPGTNFHYARIGNWILGGLIGGSLQAWPTIVMKSYGLPSTRIFGITTHELAHSTHAKHSNVFRFAKSQRFRETYANTIEWYLTTRYYRQFRPDFVYEDNYQNELIAEQPVYTSLMVDLIDDYNQQVERGNTALPQDRVHGFTIQQIEREVMKNETFVDLRDDLKRYSNPTIHRLDELFSNWE